MGDDVQFKLRLERLGNASLTLDLDCWAGDEQRVRSQQVLVFTDLNTHRAMPMPPDVRQAIEASGYANGVSARGRMVFVAGMIGWDAQGVFHTDDLAGQVRQALQNIVDVLAAGDAKPEHIVRMTWRSAS
ncbi:hypothetical protein DL770_011453 [Monosporascus sp. CRB-9-2]|nr:hypothetical protein DL770_011453 [Monosporascus sp. CRB-9-2]